VDISDLLRMTHGIAWAADQAPDGVELTDRLLALMMDGLRRPEPTTPRPSARAGSS
jgi:hypothetical protein